MGLGHTAHIGSVTKFIRSPVIRWERMGAELFADNESVQADEYLPVPSGASPLCKWVKVETDHPRLRIMRGDQIALEPIEPGDALANGKIYLFETFDGTHFLGELRLLPGGSFEAMPDAGQAYDKDRHGIRALARKRGTWE